MVKDGLIKMARPFTAEDFYDDTVLKRVLEKHPSSSPTCRRCRRRSPTAKASR